MTKFHPFFTIGTTGIILTAILHMFLALGLSLTSIHTTFLIMYTVFSPLLLLGVVFTVKKQKAGLIN